MTLEKISQRNHTFPSPEVPCQPAVRGPITKLANSSRPWPIASGGKPSSSTGCFIRLTQKVGITKGFCAGSIPAGEGAKHDLVAPQVQRIHSHMIRAWIGLKSTHPIRAEVRLEQTLQSATVHRRRQHRRREVRKKDQPDASGLEPLQRGECIGPRLELPEALEQPVLLLD